MIVEKAQIIAIEGQYAIVKTQRRSACGACTAREGCGISILGMLMPNRFCSLRVLNPLEARVGDSVQIGIPENGLVKSALIIYALPLLFAVLSIALASAIMGEKISDLTAIAFSVAGLVTGIFFAHSMGKYFSNKSEYQVKIISIDKFHIDSSPVVSSI
ncbi:MAG: SoxR reducing system RseC family protein [Gammaproteobacteria bacterium]|nr:SoxR reducing system RseC family protein [Gammaproteobacteria bacterium]